MLNGQSMHQGLYETESPQGEITGKGFPDHDEFADRRENANNSAVARTVYPGGNDPYNLHIVPGELSFGSRESHVYNTNGEPNEHGFTSLNGKNLSLYGDSPEVAMRNHYFQGVVKTEYMVGSSEQVEGGYTFLRAGSCSVVNNGHGDIYAGDLIEWYFPDLYDRIGNADRPAGTDRSIAYRNRGGQPFTKILPQVRRYNPYNNESSIEAIIQRALRILNDEQAVPGLPQALPTTGDEGAIDVDALIRILNTGGANFERVDSLTEEALGVIIFFAGTLGDVTKGNLIGRLSGEGTPRALSFLMGAISSAQKARKDRVFAKAMSTAGPSETIHVMVSHFSLI